MSIRLWVLLSYGTLALLSLLPLWIESWGKSGKIVFVVFLLALVYAASAVLSSLLSRQVGLITQKLSSIEQTNLPELCAEFSSVERQLENLRQQAYLLRQNNLEEAGRAEHKHQEMAAELESAVQRQCQHEYMMSGMHKVSGKARDVSQNLSGEVRTLSQLIASVDHGVEVQMFRVRETNEAMDGMVHSIIDVAQNAATASEGAQASREKALVGAGEVREAVAAITTVRDTVLVLKDAMSVLGEKAGNIGAVMGVINEVADQTNLLALNAAIEAARAGEAGRGFSVVADEVRKLAEKTMTATREVEEAVLSIQEETKRNVAAVENAARYTVEGADRASRAGEFMTEIVDRMQETAAQLQSIAAATAQQSESSRYTNEALTEIQRVATETAQYMQTFTTALVKFSSSMDEMDIIVHAMETGDLDSASSDQLIQWTPGLELGIPLVDAQHRTLCSYINALHRGMQQNQGKEAMGALLADLKDYTVTHFSTEEQYFAHSKYPDTEKHKQVHRNFVAKIKDFEDKLHKGTATLSIDLLEFLKDWLIKHIQGTDTQYVKFVRESMAKHGMA